MITNGPPTEVQRRTGHPQKAPRARRARRSFGRVLDDKHGRLVVALVADVDQPAGFGQGRAGSCRPRGQGEDAEPDLWRVGWRPVTLELGLVVFAAPGRARVPSGCMHHDGTERSIDPDDLARAYDKLVIGGVFQEQGDYYVRYRNRYESLVSTYAELGGGGSSLDVLEVGGGQHALLAHALFADRATVADLPGPHLDYL